MIITKVHLGHSDSIYKKKEEEEEREEKEKQSLFFFSKEKIGQLSNDKNTLLFEYNCFFPTSLLPNSPVSFELKLCTNPFDFEVTGPNGRNSIITSLK